MKKIIKIFNLMIIASLICIMGCSQIMYVNKFNIKSSHKEWVEQIGLLSHREIKIQSYRETNKSIEIDINCDTSEKGYKAVCDIVNKHNAYVLENPDYFSDIEEICLATYEPSGEFGMMFINKGCKYYNIDNYLHQLKREDSCELQYAYILMDADISGFLSMDGYVTNKVLIMDYTQSCLNPSDIGMLLSKFSNLEQVIIADTDLAYSLEDIGDAIYSYNDKLEVYFVKSGQLEKYLP